MTLSEARKYAKTHYNKEFGKLTTTKDSQGEYTVWEDSFDTYFQFWEEGKNAVDAKVAYILWKVGA